jgi:hypothetical protein
MKLATRIAGMSAVAAFALTALGAPASAHEGALGDGGPFTIRVDSPTKLPAGIDARWGNGEVEFHVEPGIELVAFGTDGEPMAKVDKDGNMFGNTLSPTWQMNKTADMSAGMNAETDPTAEPNWEWQQAGGSLMYHEHRIHFMAASVDPAIAEGGDVSTFALKFTVNSKPLDITGALVFDPSLDTAKAEQLIEAGKNGGGDNGHAGNGKHEGHDSDSTSSGFPPEVAIIALVAALGAVVGILLWRKRRA